MLRSAAERIASAKPWQLDMTVSGTPEQLGRPDVERELLRIGQEALRNAAQHADADSIRIELAYGAADIGLTVRDDGRGFNVQQLTGSDRPCWGLIGMRERAERIGATLSVLSSPGHGTQVEVRAPLLNGRGHS
jgi:signal transduction histidine kinase